MNARPTFTAFLADRQIASGSGPEVAAAVRATGRAGDIFVFDNTSGALIDLDLLDQAAAPVEAPRGRGRPKLGVVAREVTLREMLVEGVAAIAAGENPRAIAVRLEGYAG